MVRISRKGLWARQDPLSQDNRRGRCERSTFRATHPSTAAQWIALHSQGKTDHRRNASTGRDMVAVGVLAKETHIRAALPSGIVLPFMASSGPLIHDWPMWRSPHGRHALGYSCSGLRAEPSRAASGSAAGEREARCHARECVER